MEGTLSLPVLCHVVGCSKHRMVVCAVLAGANMLKLGIAVSE